MSANLKEIIHDEINGPLNKMVDIFTPKPKKANYKLMVFWFIAGILAISLLYYTYKILYIYF